jgi:quinol monooxygenase YgiN
MLPVMFRIYLRMQSPPGKRDELLNVLKLLLNPISVIPGCLQCRLYEDTLETGTFLVVEDWQKQEDLVLRIKTGHFKKLLTVMELSDSPPEIRCESISSNSGIEFIEAFVHDN